LTLALYLIPQNVYKKIKIQKMIEDKLEIARRLFRKFDTDNSGTITENEVDIFFIKK
jgi:Ca2+-binding EF-hand superfamily protein